MKKKFMLIILLTAICIIVIIGLGNITNEFTGTLTQDGTSVSVDAKVQYKRYHTWFRTKNPYGSIAITSEDFSGHDTTEYMMLGSFLKADEIYTVTVTRYSEEVNAYVFGTLFFDKEMENIILSTDELELFSANDSFIEKVNEYRGTE